MFQFIRIEDTAYDRSNLRISYLADTGEPRAVADPATTRLRRAASGTEGPYPSGRIWKLTLGAEVNQTVRGAPALNRGAWESSGIVDASSIFGPGAFLVDVQAHGWDSEASGPGVPDPPAMPKREKGQLLLLRAPGS